ncbi:MAG: peptide chain release factor-like protein [Chloroflexi bacterium]|nr:peptide chain release factor-like protein [Chloroflexota bacterium]
MGATATDPTWREFLGLPDEALLQQCEVDRYRASGPGGQKRNVSDSAVRLRHRPSGLQAQAHESRSQHENRARALKRLRRRIALSARAPAPSPGEPSPPELRPLAAPGPSGTLHRRDIRYLPAVAALLDLLEAHGGELAPAAAAAGIGSARAVRLLARDPAALVAANAVRARRGLRPLRRR